MGYLYDSLKNAIGGKSPTAGSVIKGWSPNEIRCIFIMRNFIMVTDYLKPPKIIWLDPAEVGNDLGTFRRSGNLNNLLESRQLSCLEEIYVDIAFEHLSTIIDLRAYIQKVYNQTSRLRYFGYINPIDDTSANQLASYANSVMLNGTFDFTFAKSVQGLNLNAIATENANWYKKYNLRPQYYDVDTPRGRLHTYFAKCERTILETAESSRRAEELQSLNQVLSGMLQVDLNSVERISDIQYLINYARNCDESLKVIADRVRAQINCKYPVDGLNSEVFTNLLNDNRIRKSNALSYLMERYKRGGVFDTQGKNLTTEKLVPLDGFFRLGMRLDLALADVIQTIGKNSETKLMILNTCKTVGKLPKGKLSAILKSKGFNNFTEVQEFDRELLIRFFYTLCGYDEDDWVVFIMESKKGGNES